MMQVVEKKEDKEDSATTKRRYGYLPKYAKELEEHLALGYSIQSFTFTSKISGSTIYDWFRDIPEFAAARTRGLERGLELYETILKAQVTGIGNKAFDPKKGNTTALMFLLKTRFYKVYGDKSKLDLTSSDGSMTPQVSDEQRRKIAEYVLKETKKDEGK